MAYLLLAMLRRDRFEVRYVAGIVGHRMRAACTREHKTDARDAQVLAHTGRMRPDLPVLEPVDELLIELDLLISRRTEMSAARTNAIMKLRNLLTGISPPLERVLDVRSKGPLAILGFWQTPAAIRAAGPGALELLLRQARVAKLAETIVVTANCQLVEVLGQASLAVLAGELAADILVANRRLITLGQQIASCSTKHPLTAIVGSVPGFGTLLTAEFLVHTNGMREYTSAAKLAAHAGLVPVAVQTGTTLDGTRPPTRYHRGLRRVFWHSAFSAITCCPASKAFYDCKHAEGNLASRPSSLSLAAAPTSCGRWSATTLPIGAQLRHELPVGNGVDRRRPASDNGRHCQMWRCFDDARVCADTRTRHACPRCASHSDGADMLEYVCSGQLIEHDDGTLDCQAGERCLGVQGIHASSATCRMFGPCPKHCEPLTLEAGYGLECVTCGQDLRAPEAPETVVVGRFAGQLFACRGACAEQRMGNPDGTGESPVPLASRVRDWEA